ncbi:hypothetical protein ACFQ5C_23645, partial [Methylobacterium goesingense]
MLARTLIAVMVSVALVGHARAADPAALAPEAPAAGQAPFFLFSDTQVSYRYQFPAANPGSQVQRADGSFRNQDAPKHILNLSHADA